jgi:hypothetical protein
MLAPRSCGFEGRLLVWVSFGCRAGWGVVKGVEKGTERGRIQGTYIDGTDKVLVSHEYVRHGEAEDDGQDPCADEAFDCFLGRELDELGAAEGDAADVGEDVIGDDEGDGQEEPDHAFEDVVHDKVGLYHDQVEGHVRPGELGELESVVALLQRADEEHEACMTH